MPLVFPAILTAVSFALAFTLRKSRSFSRTVQILVTNERVLILGASAGIGRQIALQYARRGASICVVARREQLLDTLLEDCRLVSPNRNANHIRFVADYSDLESLLALHDALKDAWGGLDTVIVNAGVASLRPVLEVAGVSQYSPSTPDIKGLKNVAVAASSAISTNFTGPLLSAVVFIPLLQTSSISPAILLTSSLAAVTPAPTRALYCSSKAAALILFQSLAIEHPRIKFSYVLPATVEGDFRKSAVDGGEPTKAQEGLSPDYVASACLSAVDNRRHMVYLPCSLARRKYKYHV